MRNKLTKITLTEGIVLAITFTINACGDDNSDEKFSGAEYEYWKEYYKYYAADDQEQRCQNGVVEYRCWDAEKNGEWHNPLTHYCSMDNNVKAFEACGGMPYAPEWGGRCKNNVIEFECYGEWYNTATHMCYNGKVTAMPRCGNLYLQDDDDHERCNNGVREKKCGLNINQTWYNPITHYCEQSNSYTYTVKAKQRCGN
jgi:hypothetical protein